MVVVVVVVLAAAAVVVFCCLESQRSNVEGTVGINAEEWPGERMMSALYHDRVPLKEGAVGRISTRFANRH